MNKVFVVLFLFVAVFGFSQEYVEELDGFDWVNWSVQQRQSYIQGFLSAYSSVIIRYYDEAEMEGRIVSEEEYRFVEEYFLFNVNIGQIFERVDSFYSSYDNRRYPVIQVILLAGGKDYWN